MNKIQMLIDSKNLQDMYAVIDAMNGITVRQEYTTHIGFVGTMETGTLRAALFEYVEKQILTDIVSKAKE